MREITLKQAHGILQQCWAVELEGRLLDLNLLCLDNEYDNEFCYLYWQHEHEDGQLLDVFVSFREGDNQLVLLDGSKMTLISEEGEEEEVTLLKSWYAEQELYGSSRS